jgi:hypothetical protein
MTNHVDRPNTDDYQALVEGRISPEEYAERLKAAVADEEVRERSSSGQRDRIQELVKGPSVFFSYAHDDRDLARALAIELEKRGAAVWIDEGELRIGDSIIERVAQAIADVDYIVVLVSERSVASPWVAKELSLAATRVLERQGVKVLPIRVGAVRMPAALTDTLYLQLDPNDLPDAANRIYHDLLRHAAEAKRPSPPPPPPSVAASAWDVSPEDLVRDALAAAQRSDRVYLSAVLNALPAAAATAITDLERFRGILDSLAALAGAFIAHDIDDWAPKALRGFERLYNDTFDAYGAPKAQPGSVPSPQLWLEIIIRIEAVGALAVRLQRWDYVRQLGLTPLTAEREAYNPFALRHGLTMAARANLFDRREGDRTVQLSLIVMAKECAERVAQLQADFPPNDQALLNSILQFDALAALTAIAAGGSPDTRFYYTNFARFYSWRTEPAIVGLIDDPAMRQTLFPANDDDLALAISVLNRLAKSEAFRFDGWDGISNPRILAFLDEHPQDEELVRNTLW